MGNGRCTTSIDHWLILGTSRPSCDPRPLSSTCPILIVQRISFLNVLPSTASHLGAKRSGDTTVLAASSSTLIDVILRMQQPHHSPVPIFRCNREKVSYHPRLSCPPRHPHFNCQSMIFCQTKEGQRRAFQNGSRCDPLKRVARL